MANQNLPFQLSIAPFPEGFQGDLDETFQQAYANTVATVQGNFLTGLVLPPGSTLPTSDQGPVAMGSTWYFWDPTTQQYLPQAVTQKGTKNFARNPSYQVVQVGPFTAFAVLTGGIFGADMTLMRVTQNGYLTMTTLAIAGPPSSADNDLIPTAVRYTSSSSLASPAATDYFSHEHLIEGIDITMLQGQVTSLSFSCLATAAGTYSAYITNSNRDTSYVANFTIAQANVWTRVKIPGIPAFPTGTGTWTFGEGVTGLYIGVVMALGGQFKTSSPNQWVSGLFMGTASNLNMLGASNNQLTITGMKFEAAASPTYYQTQSLNADFEEMLRYYYTNYNYQSTTAGAPINGVCSAAAVGTLFFPFPRRMCPAAAHAGVPSVIPYSPQTNLAGTIRNLSTSADVSIPTLTATPKAVSANGIAMTGAAKADVISCLIRADARIS